jgi:mRNA interferase RelE/StbE
VSYDIQLTTAAGRDLARLDRAVAARVADALRSLAGDPFPQGAKPLAGALQGLWRVRVGAWRIAYEVDQDAQMVRVVEVAHRAHVYDRAARKRPGTG